MRSWVAAIAILLVAVSQAYAESLQSKTFTFGGRCDGHDMVYKWSLNDGPPGIGGPPPAGEYGHSFIYPWLDTAIVIRGVEAAITSAAGWEGYIIGPPHYGLLMVGNNTSEDIMLTMGGGNDTRGMTMFPSDTGFTFPGRAKMTPLSYIDLHATCTPYRRTKVIVTLYYTVAKLN
jgi:hypothetical protein